VAAILVDLRHVVGGSAPQHRSGIVVQRAVLRLEGAVLGMSLQFAAEAHAADGMQGRYLVDTGGRNTMMNGPGRDAETGVHHLGVDERAENKGAWLIQWNDADPGRLVANEETGTSVLIESESQGGTIGRASRIPIQTRLA